LNRHADEIGVTIPSLAVGKGKLGAFDDDMNEIRTERVEIVEVESFEQRQLLEQNRSLAPRTSLGHGVAVIVEGERRFDRGLPARHIGSCQQPAVAAAGGVEHLLTTAETVDRLGDKTAVPRLAGTLDLSVAATIGGFQK